MKGKWCIQITEQNKDILRMWRKSVATTHVDDMPQVNSWILSEHKSDGSYYYNGSGLSDYYDNYERISFEKFIEITGFVCFTVTREQFKKGYELACSEWKQKLMDKIGNTFILNDECIINNNFVTELKNAASSTPQLEFLEELFPTPKKYRACNLKIGETMVVDDDSSAYHNHIIMSTYNGYVDLNSPNNTWSLSPSFEGYKVKTEFTTTKI